MDPETYHLLTLLGVLVVIVLMLVLVLRGRL